jgi:cell division protein FtsQ
MSREGRWRLVAAGLRMMAALGIVATLAWGGWQVVSALRENAKSMPAAARAAPLKKVELKTNVEGVLNRDPDWLGLTLALPKNITLMEVDLRQLRERLLEDGQVLTANLTRKFPDRLAVQITERSPIARLMVESAPGESERYLVARDGVIFRGAGYDSKLIATLPWLDGVTITRQGRGFLPLAGMDRVSDLLAEALHNVEHLYQTWRVVSLARLQSDREIEVRSRAPHAVTIVFNANGDFFRQLAKLDYLWDKLAGRPNIQARIDLTLGRQVPVVIEPRALAPEGPSALLQQPTVSTFSALPAFSFQPKREF